MGQAGGLPSSAVTSVEISVKPALDRWGLAAAVPLAIWFIVGGLVFVGVSMALTFMVMGLLLWSFISFLEATQQKTRAFLDGEGMTLLPRRQWLLSAPPFRFRWDEVVEVTRPRTRQGRMNTGVLIRLKRPTRFWTLHWGPVNRAAIPLALCRDPRFASALRAHLPAERIGPEALDMSNPDSPRHARVLATAMFACALVAGWSSLSFARAGTIFTIMAPMVATLAAGVAFLFARHEKMPAPLGFIYGLLLALGYGVAFMLFPMLMFPHGMELVTGWFGASAGALFGAGIAILTWRRLKASLLVFGVLALTSMGFFWGRSNTQGLIATRVGGGSVLFSKTWTPKGDAFLMIEGAFAGTSTEASFACWYSSDLKLERRSPLPKNARLVAVGETAALFNVSSDSEACELLYVPRNSELRPIGEAQGCLRANVSPDGRYALVVTWGDNWTMLALHLCDLTDGALRPLHPPMLFDRDRILALRNDRTMIWAEGSFARDKGGNTVTSRTPLPESGEFPHPGEQFVIKQWSTDGNLPAETLHAAKSEWLEWPRPDKMGNLRLCRVSESKPAHVEYALLDLSRSTVVESTLSDEAFEAYPLHLASYDGRYVQIVRERGLCARTLVTDTQTGKDALLPIAGLLSCWSSGAVWSPAEHKFLMEVPVVGLGTKLLSWRRGPRSPQELFTTEPVVYMVDMDAQ